MTEETWHGTLDGYQNHHCRCAECRQAKSEYQLTARANRRFRLDIGYVFTDHASARATPKFHNANTYTNWGCRCEKCRADAAVKRREQYLRAKQRAETPGSCHCGEPIRYGFDGDPTHHRGMCGHCDDVRCDAYPGACTSAPVDGSPDHGGNDD